MEGLPLARFINLQNEARYNDERKNQYLLGEIKSAEGLEHFLAMKLEQNAVSPIDTTKLGKLDDRIKVGKIDVSLGLSNSRFT